MLASSSEELELFSVLIAFGIFSVISALLTLASSKV
jgi:hypothetical protein